MIVNDGSAARDRVTPNTLAALELPLNDRIAYIRKPKWFGYAKANDTLDRLEDLITYPACDRMPNLLIAGHTNNGKTSLVRKFLDRYPPCDNPDGGAVKIPVFYMQAPPVPDEGRFYDEILEALFAPYKSTDKIGKKEKEVLRLLKVIDTKMLVIDEIHNLIAGPMNRQHGQLNAIKNLGNNLQIPIVAVGTQAAFRAIRTDEQISNRFRHVYLDKWQADREFVALLKSFEKTLALKEPSNLATPEMSMELHRMSEGILGEVVTIIVDAAVYALRKGKESITIDTLRGIQWVLPSKRSLVM